jgi:hypothetical protein
LDYQGIFWCVLKEAISAFFIVILMLDVAFFTVFLEPFIVAFRIEAVFAAFLEEADIALL